MPVESPNTQSSAPQPDKGWSYRGENWKLTSQMQFELARRFYGLPKETGRKELDDVILRWADADNAANSREFRKYVEAHPAIVERYKRDPEAALREIEEHIYETHHG
jgi:hypothetical protein